MNAGRQAILDVREGLEKRYKDTGDGLFPPLDGRTQIPVIPSPSAMINAIMGVGGFPRGRITEIFGPESTGKTTLAIEAARAAQQQDPETVILFLDYEHAFDHTYAARLGLDVTDPARFIYCQPQYFEQGAAVLQAFIKSGMLDMAVIDSVAAMLPLTSFEGDPDPAANKGKSKLGRVGLHAQLLSQNLNWLVKRISSGRKPAIIAINQMRSNIDTVRGFSTQQSTGGAALRFYSTIRLELGRAKGEGEADSSGPIDQIHQQARVVVTCVKNKVAPPWMRGAMVIKPNVGIDNVESTADLAVMYLGIKAGAWFKYQGPTDELSFSVQGRPSLIRLLEDDPALTEHLQEQALNKLQAIHDLALKPQGPSKEKVKKRKIGAKTPSPVSPNGESVG